MTPFLQLIFTLSMIILAAKAAGLISTRFRQPAVLGELMVGLVLGPSLIDFFHLPFVTDLVFLEEVIDSLAEMGVLLLMFIAGLELQLSELKGVGKASVLIGTMGVIFPLAFGAGYGWLEGMSVNHAIFLGLSLAATSVSISAQTLMELKVLRTRVGYSLLGAAVLDDVLVILLLSIFLALGTGGGSLASVLWIIVRMLLFLGLSFAFGLWILPWMVRRVRRLQISQGVLSLALVILLLYGVAAEVVGNMAAITGAFLAGLMFGRTDEKEILERGIRPLAYGFLVPIFFVNIGIGVQIKDLGANALGFTAMVIILAVVGKILGSGSGALLAGYTPQDALRLGAGMVSRGEVGLVLASVGIKEGFMPETIFSSIVGMVLATTLITPPLLRSLFKHHESVPGNQ
jgi:Kef-type K+ transport system membrane component KefB